MHYVLVLLSFECDATSAVYYVLFWWVFARVLQYAHSAAAVLAVLVCPSAQY